LIKRRLLTFVPLLICMTFLSFAIMHLAPGDPGMMFLDPQAGTEDIAQIRQNLGLDKPLVIQYFYWLKNILKGDFGYSYVTSKPVLKTITERLPATLLLSVSSMILILLITFPLGLISGAKQGSKFDHFVTVLTFVGLSIPTFWLGLMFILLFSLKWNMLPTAGFMDPMLYDESIWIKIWDVMKHMALPLLTIIVGGIAGLTRYHRFGIINILKQDYITAARARGVSEGKLLFKHAFKNAALPIVTILGLQLPYLIGGSFVIEYIFSWPGMGQLGVASIFARDYPVLMGTILFSSILIIVGNFLADMAYSLIDPRIE
jgi:peptide/nickel transport system permease protein